MSLVSLVTPLGRGLVGASLVLAGVLALVRAYPHLQDGLVLWRATPASVADVQTDADDADDVGTVAVEGIVVPLVEKRVEVPDVSARAVAGTALVETLDRRRLGPYTRERWKPIDASFVSVPFGVDDGSGVLEIEPPESADAFGSIDRFERAVDVATETQRGRPARPLRTVRDEPDGETTTFDVAEPEVGTDDGGSRRAVGDGGYRSRRAALTEGEAVFVVGRVTERFGNRYLTGEDDPDGFRLVTGEPPSTRRALAVGGLSILVGLGSLAASSVALAGFL